MGLSAANAFTRTALERHRVRANHGTTHSGIDLPA